MNGKYYRMQRKRRDLTQADVADMIGISRHSLSTYEKERSDMPVTVALKLNKLYGMDGDEYILRDDRYLIDGKIGG